MCSITEWAMFAGLRILPFACYSLCDYRRDLTRDSAYFQSPWYTSLFQNWYIRYHSTIIAPTTTPTTNAAPPYACPLPTPHTTELALLANVVTNPFVGSGAPLTVTVGIDESGVTEGLADAAVAFTIENLADRQCITPCVEFMSNIK